jgi:hypothetical protein
MYYLKNAVSDLAQLPNVIVEFFSVEKKWVYKQNIEKPIFIFFLINERVQHFSGYIYLITKSCFGGDSELRMPSECLPKEFESYVLFSVSGMPIFFFVSFYIPSII